MCSTDYSVVEVTQAFSLELFGHITTAVIFLILCRASTVKKRMINLKKPQITKERGKEMGF